MGGLRDAGLGELPLCLSLCVLQLNDGCLSSLGRD